MDKKIAVVTGSNRGIGFEVAKQLAKAEVKVILTSRDEPKGRIAAKKLQELGLDIIYHQLDVTDIKSIDSLAKFIKKEFGKLDILVNNAGIMIDSKNPKSTSIFDADLSIIKDTMLTNVYGPLLLSQRLIPLMKKQNYGRVINVSSGMGQLTYMNGNYPAYRLSKTGINTLTRILADELKDTNIAVNSVCPGWVRTDMGGKNASRSVELGADTIVWLALEKDVPSGLFFRDRKQIPW